MRIWSRYRDVVIANWHIGFTAFGGPAVQFQTVRLSRKSKALIHGLMSAQFHEKFVSHLGWIDEPMVRPMTANAIVTVNESQVPTNFCHQPSTAGFGKYQNALLYQYHS